MEKSGPRHSPLKSPLIERDDLQSPQQRTLYGVLTLVFWAAWFYLWLPMLALLAWALGIQQAYKYMILLGGYHDLLKLLAVYGLIIIILGGALILWATYNIIRFSGVERRTAALPVTPKEIGQYFGQDPVQVTHWQSERRLHVVHEKQGRIARVDVLTDEQAPLCAVTHSTLRDKRSK